jgi:hypothetical protein
MQSWLIFNHEESLVVMTWELNLLGVFFFFTIPGLWNLLKIPMQWNYSILYILIFLSCVSTQPKLRPGQMKRNEIASDFSSSKWPYYTSSVSTLLQVFSSDSFFGRNANLWAAGSTGGDAINIATVYTVLAITRLRSVDAQHGVQNFSCHHVAFLWSGSWWSERSSKKEDEDWCDLHDDCAKIRVVQEVIRS